RVRRELSPNGNKSTTIFLDDWSEVQDGRLVRYLVHNGQRIVRLADDNGAPSQSGLAGGVESSKARWGPNGHNEVFRMLTATTLLTIVLVLTLLARGWRRRPRLVGALLLLGVAGLVSCPAERQPQSLDLRGSITTLTEADTLLLSDGATGTLSEEIS